MKQLIFLTDLDDTLENLCEIWIDELNKRYKTNVKYKDITEWDMTKAFTTLTREEIFSVLSTHKLWNRVKPIAGAVEYLKRIVDDGHRVVVVTASSPQTVKMKFKVINKYFPFIKDEDVIISSQKQLIKGDVLVDDAPHNLENGEYIKILFTAPHNLSYDAYSNDMVRVSSWKEVYELVQEISNRGLY